MTPSDLHPLTLRFQDPQVEAEFRRHDLGRLARQGRVAIAIGITASLALGHFFDGHLFPEAQHGTVWVIRWGALSVALAVFFLTTHRLFERFNDLPLALVGLSGGLGLIGMSLVQPSSVATHYYPALILVGFFTYNLVGTRFIHALTIDLGLLALYNVAMLSRGDLPWTVLGLHDFYWVTASLISGGASYLSERQRRQFFCSELRLRQGLAQAEATLHQADEANQAKSRFLAAVSHDLRQPIHAQGMFLNVLAATSLSPKQREMVASLDAATRATSEMLHTLMDFSRIEAGTIAPQFRPFRLQPLLNKIEKEFIGQADARGLAYRSRETPLTVCSDPGLLEVILRNLVGNAIRYTEHGGVLLACRRRGKHVLIEVYDTGIGIPPEQHEAIFREFHQLGNPERDRQKGLGLGLAIVRGLADCLQHPLSLRSRPGRGSVFRLTLPLAEAEEALVEAPHSVALPIHAPTILLIDDDTAVREGTARQLEEWQFRCLPADSIERALIVAAGHPPDLIISDFRLREHQTGAEAISQLRAQAGYTLPALLITGDTAPERLREAAECGVPLLHKPVEPARLYRQIVALLEDGRPSREDRAG